MGVLKIGPLAVEPPVVLAPMAGVTDAPFRRLCRTFGAGLYVSEMISARAIVEGSPRTARMLQPDPDEPCRSIQLYATDPDVAGEAVRRLLGDVGPHHIDLNFGCPAGKVTIKGGGAALPAHPVVFRAVVRSAVEAAGDIPVTVKMRLGIDDTHRTFLDAARAAEDEGVAAIALHARTAEQLYSGSADWSAIVELKAAVGVPVLGNGDIWEAADARRMMAETACDGVVIGRGCLGRPWLFGELADLFAGRPLRPQPNLGEVLDVAHLHARMLCEVRGEEAGMRDFRKHVGWYLTCFPVGGSRRAELARVSTFSELEERVGELDRTVPFPRQAARTPRGHTHGPRRVALPAGWLDDVDDPAPPADADAMVSGG